MSTKRLAALTAKNAKTLQKQLLLTSKHNNMRRTSDYSDFAMDTPEGEDNALKACRVGLYVHSSL